MNGDEKKDLNRFEHKHKYNKLKRQQLKQDFKKKFAPFFLIVIIISGIWLYTRDSSLGYLSKAIASLIGALIITLIVGFFIVPLYAIYKYLSSRKSS